MKPAGCYQNYPPGTILLATTAQLSLCAIGAFVMYSLGIVWLIIYLLYVQRELGCPAEQLFRKPGDQATG